MIWQRKKEITWDKLHLCSLHSPTAWRPMEMRNCRWLLPRLFQHCTVTLFLCFVAHVILLNALEAFVSSYIPSNQEIYTCQSFLLMLCLILLSLTVPGYCSTPFVEVLSVFSSCNLKPILSIQNCAASYWATALLFLAFRLTPLLFSCVRLH